MYLHSEDAPAPHIHHHIKVVELTLHWPGQQGDIPGQHLMDARRLQSGWLSWLPRRAAPAAMIHKALLAHDSVHRGLRAHVASLLSKNRHDLIGRKIGKALSINTGENPFALFRSETMHDMP